MKRQRKRLVSAPAPIQFASLCDAIALVGREAPEIKHYRPSIAELEDVLNRDDETPIEIMPNGEVRVGGVRSNIKPLTMRENLGGEYSA